ncbi:MAG: hypothetical protein NTV93_13425 [Verrucomicrobia bacterium]|nr:hypothetical protein [Verrucomicrobiota bacterium]
MPDLLDDFAKPDPAFSPAPIWWWSGERLEMDRLRWQMDQFREMGIWQVVIMNLAPTGPLFGSDADDPAFLSEAWWEIFLAVCEYARRIGLRVYFYDQIGFSGANFQAQLVSEHPEFSGERLGSVLAEGTGRLRVVCPGDARALGAYAIVGGGAAQRVEVRDGIAEFLAEKTTRLRLVYAVGQGFDYFSKAACVRLLDTVHGEFFRRAGKYFGDVIVGSFQDELPHLPSWSATFAESFRAEFGVDLLDHLDALYEAGGEEESRLRLFYHRHRSRLAEEAMFRPFFDWHEKHGLICGFDQQGPARQGKPAACVQIYADYMATHRWYGAPGADLHGHAKIHSSLAWLYGRPRCWMEGFHSTGWGGTIEETFDWLLPWLRAGANFYNPHAAYYSTRGGFWEWAPPSMCWRQPYALHYKPFADTVSRLCKVLAQGVHEAEVAVLFPTLTAQAAMGAEGELGRWAAPPEAKVWVDGDARPLNAATNEIAGCMCWMDAMPGVLDEVGLDYHFLDDESLAGAGVEGGRLALRGCRFSTVILPAIEILEAGGARRLLEFARAGGTILALHELPARILDGDADLLAKLRDCIELCRDAAALRVRMESMPRAISLDLPGLHRRTEAGHILFIPACMTMGTDVKRLQGGAWFEYESCRLDPTRYAKDTTVRFAKHPGSLVRWDPVTGTRRTVEVDADGAARVDFEGCAYVVLAWDDAEGTPAMPKLHADAIALSDRWTMDYVPTLKNAFFDMGDAADPGVELPRTWALGSEGRTVWAGFGVYGWKTKACAPEKLPPVPEAFPAPGWEPVVYSPERGIFKDRIHHWTLGPKGHVPEEFVDLWEVEAGQSVRLCAFVDLDAEAEFVLAAGSAAQKSLRVHDEEFREASEARLWLQPLRLKAGRNRLEFVLTARRSEWLRFHWSLLRPGTEKEFLRLERIAAADAPSKGSRLRFRKIFHLASALTQARLQVAVLGVGRVYFDGKLLGRQGGFDPYAMDLRVQPYDLPATAPGTHEIIVEVTDPGQPGGLFADLLGELDDGNRFTLMSDALWEVARDDASFTPVAVRSNPHLDPSYVCLWRRPHPLPGTAWLEGPQAEIVCSPTLSTGLAQCIQNFEWTIPPGARTMTIPLCEGAEAELFIEDKKVIPRDGSVSLGESPAPARAARMEVRSTQLDGGVFTGPISYNFGSGTLLAGSWHTQGLGNYSGAIRMRQTISSDEAHEANLDLGSVRGTVEVWCNGQSAGMRFAAPWTFDLPLRPGENTIELLVTNTLAPWMQAWSPTAFLSSDQLPSGVMGPVKLTTRA